MHKWRDYLNSAPDAFGVGVTHIKDSLAEFASPTNISPLETNRGEMSVTCVLTTPTCDRQGDIVEPLGCDTVEHRSNPIVMFGHGRDHKLPIGKAEDPSGKYTVRLINGNDGVSRLVAKTYFSQSSKFANDVFGLVDEDILRGVSVGFDPIEDADGDSVEVLGDSPTLERKALRFKAWKLLEYSHTPLGVNKEALTVAVNKAMDGSRSIHPKLLKFLQPFASPRKTVVTGGFSRVEKSMASDAYEEPALGDTTGDVMPDTTQSPNDEQELPTPDEGGGEGELTPAVSTSYDTAQMLMDICAHIEERMKKSEHKDAKAKAAKFCGELKDMADEWKAYGDDVKKELDGDTGDAEGEESDGEGDEMPDDEETDESKDMEGDDSTEDDNADDEETEAKIAPIQKDATGAIIIKGYKPLRLTFGEVTKATKVAGKQDKNVVNKADADSAAKLKSLERECNQLRKDQKDMLNSFKNYKADAEAALRLAQKRAR